MRISTTLFLMAILTGACPAAEKPQPLTPPTIDPATGLPIKETEPEKRFDLDFKGGLPQQLVEAVERAAKMPVNAIIPEEHAKFFLPPLKLRNVTVPQLFEALTRASTKVERYNVGPPGSYNYQQYTKSFGFRTSDKIPGSNSIWYFFVDSPPPPPEPVQPPPPMQSCRFWQLEPYLETLKVEDITTAIETGWKMLAVNPPPKLSFHKDTKLLIVVGQPEKLALVDDVLRELTPRRDQVTGLPLKKAPGQSAPAAGEKSAKQ